MTLLDEPTMSLNPPVSDGMDPQIKARWIEALTSGKYSQTTGHLRDEVGFCCLGVLCDIVDPEGWEREDEAAAYEHRAQAGIPAISLMCDVGLYGIVVGTSDVGPVQLYDHLAESNDQGATFEQIAAIIEAEA